MTNESGVSHVTLSTIKTYDLVGTPGFSQAKLNLKENQTLECLNESAEDDNQIWAIVEGSDDDLLGGGDDDSKDDQKKEDNSKEDKEDKKDDKSEDKKSDKDDKEDDKEKENKEDNKNNDNVNMKDLKEAIDKLTEKVTTLEAELHVAQESLNETKSSIPTINYDAIQKWVTEEFGTDFKSQLIESIGNSNVEEMIDNKLNEAIENLSNSIQSWVVEEFAPEVQSWVVEEFAPEVQNWITEEFAPEVQNWVCEEFAPEVQNWVCEEFAPEVQNWITEEFAPVIDNWINEEFAPEQMEKINENVNTILKESKAGRLEEIDSLLDTISANNTPLEDVVKENAQDSKWKGVYVVENMPAEMKPLWEMLEEARQEEIVRSSRMYDFTKEGVLESFWNAQDLTKKEEKQVNENEIGNNYHKNIYEQMMKLRR